MKALRVYTSLLVLLLTLPACGRSPVAPEETQLPGLLQLGTGEYSTNQFSWGVWNGYISADRSTVELIPDRSASLKMNVLRFLEQNPCTDCLQLVGKEVVGPNRIDISIQIHHPFPNLPQFTGFDVCGGIQFPWSRCVEHVKPFNNTQGAISWRFDDSPQLLNPEGYRTYFTNPRDPPWKGFIEGKLGGKQVDEFLPPSLYWPYRNFKTTPTRNMFEVWSSDMQTYELWLPEGQEIKFGYVVIAHWMPPDTIPVTDPATQFPREVNRGPYRFEVLETTGPASSTQDATVRFRVYYHSCLECNPFSHLAPYKDYIEYTDYAGIKWKDIELISEDNEGGVNEYLLTFERMPDGPHKGPPGVYPYLITMKMANCPLDYQVAMFVFEIEAAD